MKTFAQLREATRIVKEVKKCEHCEMMDGEHEDDCPMMQEKTLTPAEKKKREEIAKAMERENPGMDMSKKMAIATAAAKRVAEASTEKLRDYASAALQDKNKAKADKRWKYASKAMQRVADREVKAAHDRKYNK